MANPGGVGTKFVSVNLNKSYGSVSHHHHSPYGSNSYGQAAGARVRPGSNVSGGGGGGGGGGMVVLSRPRSSQKAAPKLSVPPPLNLPSLRKEHERFDVPGSGGVSAGAAGSGSGPRPSSSGLGWTKPGALALQEKDVNSLGSSGGDTQVDAIDRSGQGLDDVAKGSGGYVPPSARMGGGGLRGHGSSLAPSVEKAAVLRGEDFPSLRAALPSNATGPVQKQKDGSHKQKHVVSEGSSNEHTDNSLTSVSGMRPQGKSFDNDIGAGSRELSSSARVDHAPKQEIFPSPLPLVQLRPRSDWADDERDTGHGFSDRGRDNGFSKHEPYWDGEFDMPRNSVLPHKPARNPFERWGKRDDEAGKTSASEVPKVDLYRKDVRTPSREGREGNFWRAPPLQNNGFNTQEVANDRHGIGARPMGVNREIGDNKYNPSYSADSSRASVTGNRESTFGRRDIGHGHEGGHQVDNKVEPFNSRRSEGTARDRYGSQQPDRYRSNTVQDNIVPKTSFSSGSRGLPVNDPLLNFSKEKRAFSKSEKTYMDDPFLKDFTATSFDESDTYTGSLLGVIKKKKDVVKVVDFHDPVRESFEAELERVQKLQEQERQRIIEEQERAMDQARREEEERQRLVREEEEMQRKIEAEAREAAWREEQEQLEALRMAEEQRIAREEEKQRIFMEEERRKQAAKQKLLELEARMAKRQSEAPKSTTSVVADGKSSSLVIENEFSSNMDLDNWEDSERMVERITTGSTDPSISRPTDMASSSQPYRESSSGFIDRAKPSKSWRMDGLGDGNSSPFLAQDQGNGHRSPRREVPVGGRAFPRKDFSGGAGYMSIRPYVRGGMQEPLMDDSPSSRGLSWNASGGGDIFRRNTDLDPEFYENHPEKIDDVGWGQERSRGDPHSYPDRLYAEASELYPPGRLRNSMRQPRVLPPPVLASTHKASFRGEHERPSPSSFIDSRANYNNEPRSDSSVSKWYYGAHPENFGASQIVVSEPETTLIQEQKQETTPRCDSQSSLSVSSPPSSPTHLSHDDLDESADSPVAPALTEGRDVMSSSNDSVVANVNTGKDTVMPASSSISAADEEDWALQNNEKLQEQEEYEDVDGYQEDDEVHDGDDEQIDLTRELEDLQLEETNFSCPTDNLVLGFDEGVEVQIPNDDLERSSRDDEGAFGLPELSLRNIKDQRPVDGIQGEDLRLQPSGTSPRLCTENFPGRSQETEEAIHDSIVHDMNIDAVKGTGSSVSTGEGAKNVVLSSVKVASHSSSVDAIASSVPSQVDLPLNLQFGLFSGPSLLPTPIPAIQIGSIQMPLHLHPPIGSSLTHHMQPSQPPLFQFGQFRYTSPISQGVLPISSQSVPFVQSNVQAHYHPNQSPGGPAPTQSSQDSTGNQAKVDPSPGSVDRTVSEHNALMQKNQSEISHAGEHKVISERNSRPEDEGWQDSVVKNQRPSVGKPSGGRTHSGYAPSQSLWSGKDARGAKFQNRQPGINGNKFSYSARGSAPRSSFPGSEAPRLDSGGFQRRPRRTVQRTEFRVRENVDRKLSSDLISSTNPCQIDDSVNKGKDVGKSGSNYEVVNRPLKQNAEAGCSSSDVVSARGTDSKARTYKINEKEASRTENIRLTGEGSMKTNVSPGEDVDAPLQSGVVCVFKQPGIEGPSDDDDFIEVRSKRQMLNDRREQREKENKAKSQISKAPRKPRSTAKGAVASTSSSKFSASAGGGPDNARSKFVAPENGSLANTEVSAGFPVTTSQPLAPIGTPAMSSDAKGDKRPQNIKSHQAGSASVISSGGKNLAPGPTFENKNKVLNNVQTSLGSWGGAQLSPQVMVLTQTQLDEAMKPGRYDKAVAPVESHSSSVTEPILPTPPILTKEKAFSSTASPINSLLAGEKIQFGAVTSPTVLPATSRASTTNGIGAPGSCRSEGQISHNLSAAQSDCALFFEKDKHQNESHLEDCEAAAEAAASAVAVAGISNDEIVGSGMGTRAVSNSDAKASFSGSGIDGISGGMAGVQQLAAQSREESLSVALPADLSVDTPPISLWPPLPSPQNSSSPMLSHFPGGAPSPFPFYEMNPMFGGPIFAFGPHDESHNSQSQPQKSGSSASGPLGTWQQCHSSVDSFYGPPAGFAGPYVGPPGGIPGVQGPPHMVVYNHFPVGQFGQVGLSFMGTTYIPSGKQPDWKHNPSPAPMGISEGDMNNINMVPAQRNPLNMAGPVQHLTPGSPLLPIASPLAMFDVSPFQTAPDMSIQGRWSHLPASPLHSVPLSLPLQQQEGGGLPPPPPYNHHGNPPVDQPLPPNRFPDSRTPTPSDGSRTFPVAAAPAAAATQLPDELGLVSASSSNAAAASSTQTTVEKSLSSGGGTTTADGGKTVVAAVSNNVGNPRPAQPKNVPAQQQYGHSSGYNSNYQRGGGGGGGGVSQRNNSSGGGGDWSHRRMGFHGRNQMMGGEKGYQSSKVKQIYVAKQTTSGTSTTG